MCLCICICIDWCGNVKIRLSSNWLLIKCMTFTQYTTTPFTNSTQLQIQNKKMTCLKSVDETVNENVRHWATDTTEPNRRNFITIPPPWPHSQVHEMCNYIAIIQIVCVTCVLITYDYCKWINVGCESSTEYKCLMWIYLAINIIQL